MEQKDWVKRFTWLALVALALLVVVSALFSHGGRHQAMPLAASYVAHVGELAST